MSWHYRAVRTPRLVWAFAISGLALSSAGCERRGEEARPEPVTLSRPAPQRPGIEHGQDPRRAEPTATERGARAASADEAEGRDEDAEGTGDEVAEDTGRDRARKPAKRRRSGVVAGGDAAEVASDSGLRAKRLVVAREVDHREPVGVARSFDASRVTEVTAFVELVNDAREEAKIVVRFEPPSQAAFEVPLEVGASPRWRTWASTKRPLEEGTWSVRVLDGEGGTIARTTFEVVE